MTMALHNNQSVDRCPTMTDDGWHGWLGSGRDSLVGWARDGLVVCGGVDNFALEEGGLKEGGGMDCWLVINDYNNIA